MFKKKSRKIPLYGFFKIYFFWERVSKYWAARKSNFQHFVIQSFFDNDRGQMFQLSPKVFYLIKVQRLDRPLQSLDILFTESHSGFPRCVLLMVFMLKNKKWPHSSRQIDKPFINPPYEKFMSGNQGIQTVQTHKHHVKDK